MCAGRFEAVSILNSLAFASNPCQISKMRCLGLGSFTSWIGGERAVWLFLQFGSLPLGLLVFVTDFPKLLCQGCCFAVAHGSSP